MDKVMLRKWIKMRFRLQQGAIPTEEGHSTGWYHLSNSCEYDTGRTANYVCRDITRNLLNRRNDLLSQRYILHSMRMILSSRVETRKLWKNQTVSSGLSPREGLSPIGREAKDYTVLMTGSIFIQGTNIRKCKGSASNQTVQKAWKGIHLSEDQRNHRFNKGNKQESLIKGS